MKALRWLVKTIAELIVLAVLVGIWFSIIDDRLSRQLDGVDITWEELKW